MQIDTAKQRREYIRWILLLALNNGRPEELNEIVLLLTVQAVYPSATSLEIRQQLDYLEERQLVKVRKKPDNTWYTSLTRDGIDVVEYTVDVEPGIARPAKYQV